ncbi:MULTISPECIES: K(+)/H(+) antiporter subunit KhtU [Bacillaceae]|jgi:CPA2 family monovalent cation:H+ antiporter-2|uniref:K(+)/H(+) antiporter subunit KhtU n=6 Tax=Bacillus subtilis TaxID=1423 RepID=KHTU_BACSU|nr:MULTISPECIES: K(+)/H(+) antiporter subunit KhtU [Bacillales]NP_388866.2 proton/potassium antiporter; methylglyoxal resistance [Bacillus subtilis subsp. subtilis str. 168]O07536.2 RecName: Full=K(+)/H(+) antiporter subunit KhtU [Bacillus subtilis subsp. subtilis str. 168]AOL32756.1 potassium transporter [Alkalicoccobacillus gibsonii]AXC52264.1 K+/H+ antiporter YhaU [Bacillus spizizenii]MDP4111051.1 K(+)/H(+) antiporter subunit KhtU [Bacillota bacterium]CJR56774.1 Na+/H+ exchanger family pro
MDHLVFEVGTALVLVAIASVIANKIKFSIIPFLIVLGMLVGPHAPKMGIIDLTFIQSSEIIEFFGRMGVLFLLFYLGLEFSVGKLIKSGKSIAVGGTIYILINFSLGLLYGFITGFSFLEVLILAGVITISSSAIVAKVLVDLKRTANPETELILGIIMFEDIFLAVYLSVVSGLILGDATSVGSALLSILIAFGYMLLFFIAARKLPPLLNKLLDIRSNEVFIIVIFAALFFIAGFSETIHVAEAIGALLLGLVFSETEHSDRIEHLVVPFRDFFGAMFFFSFGLSIDPFSLGEAVWLALGAVILTILGNFIAGMVAGRRAGLSHKASSNIGLTIVSRGEFSIIVANLGIAGGLSATLKPFAALYVLILAILGPLVTKESKRIYRLLNKVFKWKPEVQPAKKQG